MTDFIKAFLNEDWAAVPGAPRVYVAAFGKHAGWNDHMDDVGLVTESLVEAKRRLYVEGVASQIESGAWERLEAGRALVGFDHIFLWQRPCETIVGVICSSRDGKGRTLYPLIVCAHVVAQPLDWIWGEVVPRLDAAAASCRHATTQKEVIVALNTAQEALRRRSMPGTMPTARGATEGISALGVGQWAAHFVREPGALRRVCHHIGGHGSELAQTIRENAPQTRPRGLRLPGIPGATAPESLNAWLRFLSGQIDPFWPILLLKNHAGDWVDAVVGEPARGDFFRLRAAPAAEPIVSTIPYTVNDSFDRQLDPLFTDLGAGGMPRGSFLSGRNAEEMLGAAAERLHASHRPGARGFFRRLLSRT